MTLNAIQPTTAPSPTKAGLPRRELAAAVALVAILLGISGFLSWEVPRISTVRGTRTDFIMELVALRAVARGENPYSDAVSAQIESTIEGRPIAATAPGHDRDPYHYPLPQTLIYLPVMLLPTEAAIMVARAVTVALYLAAMLLLVWRFAGATPLPVRLGLALAGIFWWPFLAVILPLAQQAGTVFALLVLAILAAERGHWSWAGAAAYVALLKPTDSGPIVLLLIAWALANRAARWPFARGFLAVGLPTAALAFALHPTWLFDWLGQMIHWRGPGDFAVVNPPATVAAFLGLPAALVWSAVAAIALGWGVIVARYVRAFATSDPMDAAPLWWSAGVISVLTLLFLPHIANYDMVVMLIAWFVAFHRAAGLAPRPRFAAHAALALLLLGVGLLAYRDHGVVEMPIFALTLLAFLWLLRPHLPTPAPASPASPASPGAGQSAILPVATT